MRREAEGSAPELVGPAVLQRLKAENRQNLTIKLYMLYFPIKLSSLPNAIGIHSYKKRYRHLLIVQIV